MIHFIGAGPGDPELLTIKGKRLIDRADVIIYAGSLVNKAVLADRKPEAEVYNSAYMTLEEVTEVMKKADEKGQDVARVHTGDPSIYGAIREQMDILEALKIDYEVIPGVYKASWPEEKIIYGTLETIADKVKSEGITKTALVVIGDFLGDTYELSKLYDRSFETEYRKKAEN